MTANESWRNWAGNQRATPTIVHHPTDEVALTAAVTNALARHGRVKAIGAGHSFTAISRPDDVMIDLARYARVIDVEHELQQVTVQAGLTIRALNQALDRVGLALPSLGDTDAPTVAGAISTASHGTGASSRGLASSVVGLRLVTGHGGIVIAGPDENPELLEVARVGLGALGLISEVTLQCEPAFGLHAVEEPRNIDDVLAGFDEWADSADHAELLWFPHTATALTKTSTRTTVTPDTRARWKRLLVDEVARNVGLGALARLGTAAPRAVPRLAQSLAKGLTRTEYTAPSHTVFAAPQRVRFKEMEYNVPRRTLPEAFARVRDLIDDLPHPVSLPVQVRVLGADDIPLSPAFERESAYIAARVPARAPHTRYFDAVEQIMNDYGGRPHWGKLHRQDAASLRFRYPRWRAFQVARDTVDPDRRFTNRYLEQVLGD